MSDRKHPEAAGQCAKLANSAKTIMALLNINAGQSNGLCTGTGTLKLNVAIDPDCAPPRPSSPGSGPALRGHHQPPVLQAHFHRHGV
jgi:hypothetical protein